MFTYATFVKLWDYSAELHNGLVFHQALESMTNLWMS